MRTWMRPSFFWRVAGSPPPHRLRIQNVISGADIVYAALRHHVPPSITIPHYSSPPVDVNAAMTKTGLTPMHVAVRAEHKDMVELLLERKARVDVQVSCVRALLCDARA